MNRISKQIATSSLAALLLALSGAGMAGSNGSNEVQREAIYGNYEEAGKATIQDPVRTDTVEGSAADQAADKTEHMLEQQAEMLSGTYSNNGPQVKDPVSADKAEGSAADKAEDKTEQMLKRSADAIYGPE